MKILFIFITALTIILSSCDDLTYPQYSLSTIEIVPDSLKATYAEWVKETVRAASEHMTGGDYEDADETIAQAEMTGKSLYGKEEVCLCIQVADYKWIKVPQKELTKYQKQIFDSLYKQK